MPVGELQLTGRAHREAVELFVSICRAHPTRTVYPAHNPPSDDGERYLGELEAAGLVNVQRHPCDPACGGGYVPGLAFPNGTTTAVEPTEEGYAVFKCVLERGKK